MGRGEGKPKGLKQGIARFFLLMLLLPTLSGCLAKYPESIQAAIDSRFPKHTEFTRSNVLRLEPGQSAEEIERIFGPPDGIRMETSWTVPDAPRELLVYQYDMGRHPKGKYLKNTNTLVFLRVDPMLRLAYWDIQLIYP